jgi:hypothetical protein
VNILSDTDSRKRSKKTVPAVLSTAVMTVIALHWVPVLSFFFAVPLFVLYFTTRKDIYAFSVYFTFVLDFAISVLLLGFQKIPLLPSTILSASMGSAFFILPLILMVFPVKMRISFRITLAGIISASAWALFFFSTNAGKSLTNILRELTDSTSGAMYAMIPEGYERSIFMARFSPDYFYQLMLNIVSFSVVPVLVSVYALGCRTAVWFVRLKNKTSVSLFRVSSFYVDYQLFYPLVLGMIGIMAGHFSGNKAVLVISWNIALTAGLFFVLQGIGILSFFTNRLQAKAGIKALTIVILFVFVLFGGWPYFFGGLLIAGVVELFVPLRARFDNKDSIDPTPGHGTDPT